MIDARGVGLRFGARAALDDVSLRVEAGELVGLVGVAAAGKSVLLKSLCGLNRPDRGEISVDGVDVRRASGAALAELRGRLGFCFQNLALFDQLDVAANVAFPLVRRGVPEEEARARAVEQLRQVGLAAAIAKRPHELSGGMKRRLALARAMVARPRVALYDDPFVGLDPVACARIARLILAAHQESGGATVVAAGDPSPLFAIAHRLVLMESGRVVADLPAGEFRREASAHVARYLGPVVRRAS